MTPALLLTNLTARGIEFQAHGDKLRFRPMNLLTQGEVETVRQHKVVILKLLRSEGQQAAEAHCGKHDNPRNWSYLPDNYKRPGWRSVQCTLCHRFIGYRPPQ